MAEALEIKEMRMTLEGDQEEQLDQARSLSTFNSMCGRQNNSRPLPQDVYILIPRTSKYIRLQRGIKVECGIKIVNQQTSKLGDYPGLPRWAQCNHNGPYET